MDWKSTAYDTAATYGKFKTIMSAVVTVIILLIILVFSFMHLGKKTKYSAKTQVTIAMDTPCNTSTETRDGKSFTVYACEVLASYEVDGKSYAFTDTINSSKKYSNGQNVTLYYDPSNPNDATLTYHINPGSLAIAGVAIGFLGIIGTIAYTWFVLKNKQIAAVTGGVHLVGDVVGAFKN